MWADRWFRIGLLGTIVAAVCCFTPVAVLVMSAIGLGAYAIWLDPIIFPAFIVFGGILVTAILKARQGDA